MFLGDDPVTGGPKQSSRTVRGTARDADDAPRERIDALSPARLEGNAATVGHLLDRWLEECERMVPSPTTMRSYRSQAERVVRPRDSARSCSRGSPRGTSTSSAGR